MSTPHASHDRPLSPHLQIWRWPLTMLMSIVHRVSGVALSVGSLLLVGWLVAAAMGPEYYDYASWLMSFWFTRLLLFGWNLALFYHLFNGIRHMLWDIGWGLEKERLNPVGFVVLTMTFASTAAAWYLAWGKLGGGA